MPGGGRYFRTCLTPFAFRMAAWFLGRNDYFGSKLASDGFESDERAFVAVFS